MTVKRKLTQPLVDAERRPGRHSAGDGLYLLVKATGRKTWVFRYRDRVTGQLRDHGLGSCDVVLLKRAREKALQLRASLADGANPIEDKKAALRAAQAARASEVTFWYCVEQCIEAKRPEWRNAKHAQQWTNTLEDYCGDWKRLPVSAIDAAMVEKVLTKKWKIRTETAKRVQQRIAAVLDWATTRGYRSGANPARWKGHLDTLLPKPNKIRKVKPRAALPHVELHSFMTELAEKDLKTAKALTLQILTATRPGEAVAATWDEFDFDNKVWTIPAERMKANRVHEVPLSPQAVSLLKNMRKEGRSGNLFPGVRQGSHVCTDSVLKLVRTMRPGMTSHGFRSTFRDWAAEKTTEGDVAEACLAHVLRNKTEAAYFRSNLLEKRAKLMAKWAAYCYTRPVASATVTPIGRKRA